MASKHHSFRIMIKNGYKAVGLITCEISHRYEAFASTFLFNFERVSRNLRKGVQPLESSLKPHTGEPLVWSFSVTLYQLVTVSVDVGHKTVVNQELSVSASTHPLGNPSSWRTLPKGAQARGTTLLSCRNAYLWPWSLALLSDKLDPLTALEAQKEVRREWPALWIHSVTVASLPPSSDKSRKQSLATQGDGAVRLNLPAYCEVENSVLENPESPVEP